MLQGGGTSVTNNLCLSTDTCFQRALEPQNRQFTFWPTKLLMELTLVSKQVDMICH